MFIGLAIQEALGVAFGLLVTVLSFWLVYRWAIKPDQERRRHEALHITEEMHRNHWDHLRTRWGRRELGKSSKPIEQQKTTKLPQIEQR